MAYKLDADDIEILQEDEVGRKYLEYYKIFKSQPFGYTFGMPDIDKLYGGLIGLYDECIRVGKKWEQLIGTGFDEIRE
jgi:hypothetical protein